MAVKHERSLIEGELVPGSRCEGVSSGPGYSASWGGVYVGQEPDRHGGSEQYHYFVDGHINGSPQANLGFPASSFVSD